MKSVKNIILILLSTLFVFSCAKKEEKEVMIPATPAELSEVTIRDVSEYISTLGTTSSFEGVDIVPQVSGQIMKINFKQGQFVKKGDVLVEIDSRPYKASVDAASADLAKSQAQLKIDELDVQRNKKLVKDGFVDKQTFDTLVAKVEVDKANVAACKAALEQALINLDWCKIIAPIDGKVGFYNINVGNIVSTNQTVITTIQNLNKLYVDFVVPSQMLYGVMATMKKNDGKLRIIVSFIEDTMKDKIRKTNASIILNKIRYETGSAILRGEMDNADHLFWPDQPVQVFVETNPIKNATLVPEICVQNGPLGPYVYTATLAEGGVYILKQVQIKAKQHYDNGTLWCVEGIDGVKLVATRVSQLRLQAGPFVYRTTQIGIPYGADNKLIQDKEKIGQFIMSTVPIVTKLRTQMMQQMAAAKAQPKADNKPEQKK